MAYKVAVTGRPGDGFRPFNQRLGRMGLGVYTPNEYVIPTPSDGVFQRAKYSFVKSTAIFREGASSVPLQCDQAAPPCPPGIGLGAVDLSGLTSSPVFWLAALGFGYWLYEKYGKPR